jgi:lysophospholipase L1-like esterase
MIIHVKKNLYPLLMAAFIIGVSQTLPVPFIRLEATAQPQASIPLPLQGKQKIVILGDSITQAGGQFGGYIWLMQRYLNRLYPQQPIELINAGISGNRATDLRHRFQQDVMAQHPDLVVINVGVNDVLHSVNPSADQPSQLEQYRQSLTAMIQAAKARNIPVLLLSPTLVSEDLNSPENLRLAEYIAAMAEVSQQTTCQYIDLNIAFKHVILTYQRYGGNSQNILTRDGIHPNLAGYQIMAYTILLGLGIPQQNLKHLQVIE